MQVRALGPGAPDVPVIGFGAMPLSIPNRPPEPVGLAVLHASLDAGVRLIDTAGVYCLGEHELGHNERLVAEALRTWHGPRDEVVVATKGGLDRQGERWTNDARPEHLFRSCDRSLTALGVERIDLYQLHAPDPAVPFVESVEALAELVACGKVRWVGLSNVGVDHLEVARRIVPVTAVQNRLSPFFRESLETGVVRYCAAAGIGFLAYSPVGGGRLNKTLPAHPVAQRIAARHGVSPHAAVTAWVLAQGPTVLAIPGARSVEHARDAVVAGGLHLPPEDLRALDVAEFARE